MLSAILILILALAAGGIFCLILLYHGIIFLVAPATLLFYGQASHLSALERNQLIKVTKQFVGRKPNTRYEATEEGRRAFREHLDHLDKLLKIQGEYE